MTGKQLVIGDVRGSSRPYAEDRWPDAKIAEKDLLSAIRDLQKRVFELEELAAQPDPD